MTHAAVGLLEAVVAAARQASAVRERMRPRVDLERAAAARRPRGEAFGRALAGGPTPRIIAECKRRSPSRGVLRPAYDPAALALAYADAGAVAVSVLTEPTFFDGELEHLRQVRAAVDLPVLRKDFIVTERQILEAREAGADAVLLIVGALGATALVDLMATASAHGLATLVEVHDESETERALGAGARVIGVNNRNLRTLSVDRGVARRLIDMIPDEVTAVAESGLSSRRDLDELQALGYDAFLIGERLMTADDPGQALAALRAGSAGHP
jgi:indole-3-glycerol phosphate synthase